MRGTHPPRWIAAVGPGLLVAATGVGAGDLATAGFAASKLGYAILWAIVVGAAVKFMLTEGLARWQLATGATLIEGVRHRLGPIPIALFLLYLVAWCYFVGVALVKASGVATQALLPLPFELGTSSESAGPLVYGAACSILGLAVAWLGGFRWFERVMGVCIAVMFLTTIISAIAVRPDWSAVATGLLVPRIPEGGTNWTIALMGGVGGTVTVLAYGYWIRQVDGERERGIGLMRLDLAVGYVATAVFGIAVAILAVGVPTEGAGVRLITGLADRLGEAIGPGLRALFLVGVWAAIVSSLIGVWQVAPSIVADSIDQLFPPRTPAASLPPNRRWRYRVPLLCLSFVPIAGQSLSFKQAQLYYTIAGAAFIPLLTLAVLLLTTRRAWMRGRHVSGPIVTILLVLALLAAVLFAAESVRRSVS